MAALKCAVYWLWRDVLGGYFVEIVRENLYIVLAFSPVGEGFRACSRAFRTGCRGGSGAILSRKAFALFADKHLFVKSWFVTFRTSSREGSGAVLSGDVVVLFVD